MIADIFHGFFFHPLHGDGYQFWSGIAGSFLTSIPGWVIAAFLVCFHHNCHVKGCKSFLRTHNDPAVHAPACRKHHSRGHLHGRTIGEVAHLDNRGRSE